MSTKALAMKRSTLFAVAVLGTFLASQTPFAAAVPISKRVSFSQRGDFVIIGNNGAFDCGQYGSGSAKKDNQLSPTVGTVDRSSCGSNISDSGGDVLWRAESTTASATTSVTTSTARTTAVLELPAGATVSYARVYWGGTIPESQTRHDPDLTIEYLGTGGGTLNATADDGAIVPKTSNGDTFYQSTALVTPFVKQHGAGAYRVSGIDTISPLNLNSNTYLNAWALVVVYQLESEAYRNITVFDGVDSATSSPKHNIDFELDGFQVPVGVGDAKLGVSLTRETSNTRETASVSVACRSEAARPATCGSATA